MAGGEMCYYARLFHPVLAIVRIAMTVPTSPEVQQQLTRQIAAGAQAV